MAVKFVLTEIRTYGVLETVSLMSVDRPSQLTTDGLVRIVRDPQLRIVNDSESDRTTGLSDGKFFRIQEEAIIDKTSCLKKPAAENQERSMRSVDRAFYTGNRFRAPPVQMMAEHSDIRRKELLERHKVIMREPEAETEKLPSSGPFAKKWI